MMFVLRILNLRNIPARAGKTQQWLNSPPLRAEHPRSRGENSARPRYTPLALGTSPLARGKQRRRGTGAVAPGNIPARAGKTSALARARRVPREHPRSRGENVGPVTFTAPTAGTSPLARGKHSTISRLPTNIRNIPARAGKTAALRLRTCRAREHPRSRGENQLPDGRVRTFLGTSPLARGKPGRRRVRCQLPGNIPARAGKTLNNQQISVPSEEFYITQLDEHVEHDAAWLDLTTPVVIRHHL